MKYLIISDIHGSSYFLERLFEKISDFDKLIILGDILYHGPRNNLPKGYDPKKVIEVLNNYKDKIIAVRGNCDAKIDLDVLDFEIKDYRLMEINGVNLFFTHGDVYNHEDIPSNEKFEVLVHGHTHKNMIHAKDFKKFINLGSLSIPKDNHHSYGVLLDNKLIVRDLLTDEIILDECLR